MRGRVDGFAIAALHVSSRWAGLGPAVALALQCPPLFPAFFGMSRAKLPAAEPGGQHVKSAMPMHPPLIAFPVRCRAGRRVEGLAVRPSARRQRHNRRA